MLEYDESRNNQYGSLLRPVYMGRLVDNQHLKAWAEMAE